MNDSRQYALIRAANYITLLSDLLHTVKKLKIAYDIFWKSRRMGWMSNSEDVKL